MKYINVLSNRILQVEPSSVKFNQNLQQSNSNLMKLLLRISGSIILQELLNQSVILHNISYINVTQKLKLFQ